MVGGSLQPVILNGRIELSLLVLQVELDAFTLNQRLVHLCLGRSVLKERNADTNAASNIEVGLQLLAQACTIHGSIAGRNTSVGTDGRQFAGLCNLDAQIVLCQLILEGLELRTIIECGFINTIQGRNRSECHLIGSVRNLDVERLIACNLKQFFQLSLVVLHIAFSLYDVEFILCSLSGELRQISLAHLSNLHHLLASLFVLKARLIALLVHLDSLSRIENLNIELCNLFLQLDSLSGRIKIGSLGSKFVQLNLIVILVSVPDGVVSRYGIISIVINLVYTCSRETVSADSASYPRRIVHALVGAGTERRKQCRFRL